MKETLSKLHEAEIGRFIQVVLWEGDRGGSVLKVISQNGRLREVQTLLGETVFLDASTTIRFVNTMEELLV